MKVSLKLDGVTYEVEAESDAVAKAIEALEARVASAEAKASEATAKADSALVERDSATKALADATDPIAFDKRAAERAALVDRARLVSGKSKDFAGTDLEVMRAALADSGEDVTKAIEGRDSTYADAYTRARFDAAYMVRSSARKVVRDAVKIETKKTPLDAAVDRLFQKEGA